MDAAPGHVDGFDLAGGQFLDRLEIAFADLEVVLDHLTERPERQVEFGGLGGLFGGHVEDQPVFADGQPKVVRPRRHLAVVAGGQRKAVFFQQVEQGDLAFLFDLGRGGRQVAVV